MDFFAHGLWSYILFHHKKKVLLAVLFGLLADSSSWGIYFVYRFITGTFVWGPPQIELIPDWVFTLYNISHSLVICAGVFALVFFIWKKIPYYLYAYPISVAIDVFTHTSAFLPTPFLWPISEWRFPGISWANPTFMAINYFFIIASFLFIMNKRKTNSK